MTNTNGAQLEIIDGGPPKPLNADEAKALDEKIRDASRKLATDADVLLSLLERAKAGQIHDALDFPSWPAYVIDAVQIAPTDKAERKMLAALMSGKGMSQRAIAAVLDVDQKTVSNDLRSGEENSSAVTDGLDGKNYKQKSKANPKRPPIRGDMRYAVDAVTKAVGRLSRVGDDDRFAGNRETLAYYRSDLQRAIDKLQEVVDKLGVDVAVVNP